MRDYEKILDEMKTNENYVLSPNPEITEIYTNDIKHKLLRTIERYEIITNSKNRAHFRLEKVIYKNRELNSVQYTIEYHSGDNYIGSKSYFTEDEIDTAIREFIHKLLTNQIEIVTKPY